MSEVQETNTQLTPATGMVTVVIPTADRPSLLEVTLRSVARQTAVGQIHSVVVSENKGSRASERICALFPDLPIEYICQAPQMSVTEHVRALLERSTDAEYVALVCDDDLWSPGHLQVALDSLNRKPSACAHFSASVHAESEFGRTAAIEGAKLLWLAAGAPPRLSEYKYTLEDILALSWVITPFSWSTMVVRSEAVAQAAVALTEAPHAAYSDRMLYPALAQHGTILYDPAIDTLYRVYAGNWQSTQDSGVSEAVTRQAGVQIEVLAASLRVDLAGLWREYLSRTPEPLDSESLNLFLWRFSDDELITLGIQPLPKPIHLPKWRRYAGRIKRAWLELRGTGR